MYNRTETGARRADEVFFDKPVYFCEAGFSTALVSIADSCLACRGYARKGKAGSGMVSIICRRCFSKKMKKETKRGKEQERTKADHKASFAARSDIMQTNLVSTGRKRQGDKSII